MANTDFTNPTTFEEIAAYVDSLLSTNKYNDQNKISGGQNLPVFSNLAAYSDYIDLILEEMRKNTTNTLEFIISQQALMILNPVPIGGGLIFNPATPLLPFPLAGGLTTNHLDIVVASSNPGTKNALEEDKLRSMYDGNRIETVITAEIPPVDINGPLYRNAKGQNLQQEYNELNIYNPENTAENIELFDLDSDVITRTPVFGEQSWTASPHEASKLTPTEVFNKKSLGPQFDGKEKGYVYFLPKSVNRKNENYKRLVQQADDLDSFFPSDDEISGYTDLDRFKVDKDLYMPFWFQDFRNQERRLYFKAFLTNLEENYETTNNVESYYGRVDPVVTFMSVTRRFNISFKVMAFSPKGFNIMWKKINNFIKMIYPTYTKGILTHGPLVRLKLGDLISDQSGNGLPGVIESPTFNYTESTWEISQLEQDRAGGKAPMMGEINFSFIALHEDQPSVDMNYNFNGGVFRGVGFSSQEIDTRNKTDEAVYKDERSNVRPSEARSSENEEGE